MIVTALGTMSVIRNSQKIRSRPGKLRRAKANAPRMLKKTWPMVRAAVTMKVLARVASEPGAREVVREVVQVKGVRGVPGGLAENLGNRLEGGEERQEVRDHEDQCDRRHKEVKKDEPHGSRRQSSHVRPMYGRRWLARSGRR